jgi:hypothetical protein
MGGSAPKIPKPNDVAKAQSGWDLNTAAGNAVLNNPNIENPYGKTEFTVSGYETVTGPNGQKMQVPRYTQKQTLSTEGQKQFDDRNALISQLYGKAQTGGGSYGVGTLDTNFLRPDEATMATNRQNVEKAIMDRANPLLEQSRQSEVARLAAMGLAPGSAKYGRVADQFERSANDLAIGATMAGGQEQSRLLDLYNRGTAASNDATATQTGMNRDARQSLISELLGMVTGQQPGSQAGTGFNGSNMGGVDYAGLSKDQYDSKLGAYNQRQEGIGTLISTIFGFL